MKFQKTRTDSFEWMSSKYRPDNLKVLFRPITMMQPDYEKIAEISLSSDGFKNAKSLARRIIELYEICSNLLLPQQHYDFGNSNMKLTILIKF